MFLKFSYGFDFYRNSAYMISQFLHFFLFLCFQFLRSKRGLRKFGNLTGAHAWPFSYDQNGAMCCCFLKKQDGTIWCISGYHYAMPKLGTCLPTRMDVCAVLACCCIDHPCMVFLVLCESISVLRIICWFRNHNYYWWVQDASKNVNTTYFLFSWALEGHCVEKWYSFIKLID
jgi:hypothetical protein